MVRGDNSGIGNQSRQLVNLIKPERILFINSESFSKNRVQHPEWYEGFNGYLVHGFPNNREVKVFMQGLTHFYCIENPHNPLFFSLGERLGVKTYCASNYEFCDNLNQPNFPLPTKFLMPSYWKVEEMKEKFGHDRVEYLPPPLDPNEFTHAREVNMDRSGKVRFLHIVGTLAAHDRNGTLDLLEALKMIEADFELVIRSQHELPENYTTNDRRVVYDIQNVPEPSMMYKDFDAYILPRRYGGLSLTTNEALMSGLPVIMPDISPNNRLLPQEWLVPAFGAGSFQTRTTIDIYDTSFQDLANKMEWFTEQPIHQHKLKAFEIAYNNFSFNMLKPKYDQLWSQ